MNFPKGIPEISGVLTVDVDVKQVAAFNLKNKLYTYVLTMVKAATAKTAATPTPTPITITKKTARCTIQSKKIVHLCVDNGKSSYSKTNTKQQQ